MAGLGTVRSSIVRRCEIVVTFGGQVRVLSFPGGTWVGCSSCPQLTSLKAQASGSGDARVGAKGVVDNCLKEIGCRPTLFVGPVNSVQWPGNDQYWPAQRQASLSPTRRATSPPRPV